MIKFGKRFLPTALGRSDSPFSLCHPEKIKYLFSQLRTLLATRHGPLANLFMSSRAQKCTRQYSSLRVTDSTIVYHDIRSSLHLMVYTMYLKRIQTNLLVLRSFLCVLPCVINNLTQFYPQNKPECKKH